MGKGLSWKRGYLCWKGFLMGKGVLLMKSAPVHAACGGLEPGARVGDRCAQGQGGGRLGLGKVMVKTAHI